MVATGIVRRIDELGRVVIPKEVRRAMKIKEGDPLEIWQDGDKLVLTKYAPKDDRQNAVDTLREWLRDEELSANMTPIERMTFKMLLDKVASVKDWLFTSP